MNSKRVLNGCLGLALAGTGFGATAMPLIEQEGRTVDLNIEAIAAVFSSEENYDLFGAGLPDSPSWQEYYVKAGLAGTEALGENGSLYWGASLLANATRGDGDAAGFTNGDDDKIDLEELFVGWKSADERFDVSVGPQQFVLADGFLIANDAVNTGEPLEDAGLISDHRGGTYWLASRKAFGNTAILRYAAEPFKAEAFWLASDNDFQGETEVAGVNFEWTFENVGTLGASYLTVTDVDDTELGGAWSYRDGMDIYNLRASGNLGVENLELGFGYALETGGDSSATPGGGDVDADAWYLQGAWTFADATWSPKLTYRYSTFSGDDPNTADFETFDPLFYGWTTGYGTWFQGEVAGNYAGPFNANADIHMVNLTVYPRENMAVGLSYFDFTQREPDQDYGSEINLYLEWAIRDNIIFSPLIGMYMPDTVGELVQGNDNDNFYAQAFLLFLY